MNQHCRQTPPGGALLDQPALARSIDDPRRTIWVPGRTVTGEQWLNVCINPLRRTFGTMIPLQTDA